MHLSNLNETNAEQKKNTFYQRRIDIRESISIDVHLYRGKVINLPKTKHKELAKKEL